MFIGTNEKLKKKIQEFNANSEWFIFSQGDLEPIYKEISGKKYSIVSSELKQKLGEIISQKKKKKDNISSTPAIIEAQLSLDPHKNKQSFGSANYGWWFSVRKDHIYQQARHSGGELIKLTLDNQKENWTSTTTECLGWIFGDSNYRHSTEWKEIWQSEKRTVEEKYNNFRNVCRAARQEIKNKIEEAKMEIAEVFADGEYFDLQPQYCFCGDSPNEQAEYYWDHLTYCLDWEERVIEFKDQVVKIVERSVGNFNQRRKEIIAKAKREAQNKGVMLEFDFWEKAVYECRDSQQLSGCEKQINDLIQTLANISEEARKEKERIARETTQEKQEQAKKEREKQQKKKTDKNNQDRQAEKLQEVQEEKAKEAENQFKFDWNKDSDLSREKKEIDKKVEELQNKLRDLENSGGTDNPSSQREKEDLNKQLWDLKMDDLTKKSPVAPSDHDQRGNSPTDSNQNKSETKKSNFALTNVLFLPIVIIVIVFLAVLVIYNTKKRKN